MDIRTLAGDILSRAEASTKPGVIPFGVNFDPERDKIFRM